MKKILHVSLLAISSLILTSCISLDGASKYGKKIYKELTKSSDGRTGTSDASGGSDKQQQERPDNELYTAIIYNNIPLVEKALKDGADINKIHSDLGDDLEQNPLLLAYCTYADEEVIQTLKKFGAKIDSKTIKNSDWWTAASNAQDRILDEMIKGGFDMSTKNILQMTAYSAIVTGNNTDYDMSRSLDVMHQHNYEPTRMDLKLCKYNNDNFTRSDCIKTIRCMAEKLKSMKKEEWLGEQLVEECTGGDIRRYSYFNITDLYCLAAFSDSDSLEYAIKYAEDYADHALLAAAAIRCNNLENYRYLKALGTTQYTGEVSKYENIVYECIADGYDDMLMELADDIGSDYARLALAVAQYFADESYFAAYIEKYGLSETDQSNLILQINTADEARWLPVVIKYGYQIERLTGRAVRAPGTFVYLDCGGSKEEALEGCWNCKECYGDAAFLEKLADDYHVNLEDKLSGMLELAVSGGYVEAAEWLLEHGAKADYESRDIKSAPYLVYNSDKMLKLLESNGSGGTTQAD